MPAAVNLLTEAPIRATLTAGANAAFNTIHIFPELPSTNDWLLKNGDCGEVCLAEQQTAGRGRRGRIWQSPAQQNIYLSLRWCYPEVPPYYGSLSLVVGLAVARALKRLGISGHGLKWPNDVYWRGKKLGGILLQTASPLQQVVIGIGLNVNMQQAVTAEAAEIDQPWCSLRDVVGEPLERNQLVALLLNELQPALSGFPTLAREQLIADWLEWDILAGKPVTVLQADEQFFGRAAGINTDGNLLLEGEQGEQQVFSAADVSVRKL